MSAGAWRGRLARLEEAGRALIGMLRPDERAALITFSERVDVRVPLTRDVGLVRDALGALQAGGATSARDAVAAALALCPDGDTRSLVIVFSDGVDNMSWIAPRALTQAIERSGVVLDAIGLRTSVAAPGPGALMLASPGVNRPIGPPEGSSRAQQAPDFMGSLAARPGYYAPPQK